MPSHKERGTVVHPITKIAVGGFKSIAKKQEIEIRPLTILAGANSSGKSSMMQAVLLLKQTLEATYDPGPLLIRGPNVEFTAIRQLLSSASRASKDQRLEIELGIAGGKIILEFKPEKKPGFEAMKLASQAASRNGWDITFSEALESDEVIRLFREAPHLKPWLGSSKGGMRGVIQRNRCFLSAQIQHLESGSPSGGITSDPSRDFAELIEHIIHLPGLRGNPARSYPISSIGEKFPGLFPNYVASLVVQWNETSSPQLRHLGDDMTRLGLTWKIEPRAVDDTRVELRVGRLIKPKQGGAKDLVNIADVGFGVSQTLPVVVALLAASPGQLVFIEQPEIHLHPRAQFAMAELLANAAKKGVRVVAETHSSLILLGIQSLVAQGSLSPADVILHWFLRDPETGITTIRTAELDSAGRFGDWPADFDEVALDAENRYLSAAEAQIAGG
jgi:hypothetical protein